MRFGVRTWEAGSWTTVETDDLDDFLNNAAACHGIEQQGRGEGKPCRYEVRNEERISAKGFELTPADWRTPTERGMLAVLWSARLRGVR